MKPQSQLSPEQKHCPICSQDLPISEFGICRARKDGRNLYCKSCIRTKVTQSRRALKEYKSARKKYISQQIEITEYLSNDPVYGGQPPAKPLSKLSPVERVRDAIRREPEHNAKLHKTLNSARTSLEMLWRTCCFGLVKFGRR